MNMTKTTKAAASRTDQLSYQEFVVRHKRELTDAASVIGLAAKSSSETLTLAQAAASAQRRRPLPQWMQELKGTSFFRLLAAAGRENCPDALNFLLYLWLRRMGVTIPEGVFVETRGTPGRPRKSFEVYRKWIDLGQPALGTTKLAVAVYGETFKEANAEDRAKMIDRCRKTVARHKLVLDKKP